MSAKGYVFEWSYWARGEYAVEAESLEEARERFDNLTYDEILSTTRKGEVDAEFVGVE